MANNFGRVLVSLDTVSGQELSDDDKKLIADPRVGGIVLFSRNYAGKKELLKELVTQIQDVACANGKTDGIPVFADQEGGKVLRFIDQFEYLPELKDMGKEYDIDPERGLAKAKSYGVTMARELREFGIISLAPVLDLDDGKNSVISGLKRAFHSDPQICAELAEQYILGMQQENMLATGKHFPGHGHADGDSHKECPQDCRSEQELRESLLLFKQLIEKNLLAAIMPAHVKYPAIDPDNTAGTSSKWINEILRGELKFNGIVISDCLSMKGAAAEDENKSNVDKYLGRMRIALQYNDIVLLCNQKVYEVLAMLDKLNSAEAVMTDEQQERYQQWVSPSQNVRKQLMSSNSNPTVIEQDHNEHKRQANSPRI